jgi:hypothetical protein
LKLNLGVRIARYARFAAAAKTMADAERARRWLREFDLQLTKQTGKFETIN